jgi:hypothetical protein
MNAKDPVVDFKKRVGKLYALQKTKKNSSIPMSTYFSNGSKQLLPWLTHRQKEILNWKMKLHKFNLNKSYCVFILSVNFLTTWFIVSW